MMTDSTGKQSMLRGLKEIIKKIVPSRLTSRWKRRMIENVNRRIANSEIAPYEKGCFERGINLIGPIDAATGLGQSTRLIENMLETLGEKHCIVDFSLYTENRIDIDSLVHLMQKTPVYDINLWHVSPSEFAEAFSLMGREAFDKHYNIAYWLWELEDFPDEWTVYSALLDEVWTPSEFVSESIRKKVDIPVYTIPYDIKAPTDERYDRKYFSLPEDKFLCLMMYDNRSIAERKNPEGAVKAYRKAKKDILGPSALVIKVNSMDEVSRAKLNELVSGVDDVYITEMNLSKYEVNSFIKCCDVYISLHRAEGFGLVMAEAMLNGVPVIATDWSANTEYMDSSSACLVDYDLVKLEDDLPPYRKGNVWADADTDAAAEYIVCLANDSAFRSEISENGKRKIMEALSSEKVNGLMAQRLKDICDGK